MEIHTKTTRKITKLFDKHSFQSGQTLIETMVAVFILIMGITAAVGLAVYALGTSTNITKQIIGTGLAREGIEAIKNMRDTNWLKDTLAPNSCYNYVTATANDANCYVNWLRPSGAAGTGQLPNTVGFDLNLGPSVTLLLTPDLTSGNRYWRYRNINCVITDASCGWGLDFTPDPVGSGTGGFYYVSGITSKGIKHGTSEYYRKITVTQNTTAPYTTNLERLDVISQVWWTDKKTCPRARDWSEALPTCRVELRTLLTNWKTF